MQTCKILCQLSSNDEIWQRLYEKSWGHDEGMCFDSEVSDTVAVERWLLSSMLPG